MMTAARGTQVAVLSTYEIRTEWVENEGVFDSVEAARIHAALYGAAAWTYHGHGATRACWEAVAGGRVWVIETFLVEPLDPPPVRRVGPRAVVGNYENLRGVNG